MTYKPVDAAIVMVVGPCIDDTDFKTLEEAIAYNAAGMDVSLIVEKTDGTTAVTAITLTTGGTSDWTHKDGGYYEIEVTAAQNAEEGVAFIRGICTGVLAFESPRYDVVPANSYDSLVKGTDVLQTDVTQWLGTAVTSPNIAGTPVVDVTRLGGGTSALIDLVDFVTSGYDSTNNLVYSDVTHWLGTAAATPSVAGVPEVDLTHMNGTTQSVIDLKDFADVGYDSVSNKVQGVVLVDITTTVTNLTNAPTNGDLTSTMKTSVNTEAKDVLTVDTIADSYATDGNQPTIAQAILAIQQMMQDKSISGTTLTVKKPDGSTTAMTFTLDSATTPTSITRAT